MLHAIRTELLPSQDIVKAKTSEGRIFTVGDYYDMFSEIRASKKYSNYYGIQLAHNQYYKSKTCIQGAKNAQSITNALVENIEDLQD